MNDRVFPGRSGPDVPLPHARSRIEAWTEAWRRSGRIVLLLDFDGTLAPIVERPEQAGMPDSTRDALERLLARGDVDAAIVSGRGLEDARERIALQGLAFAGNHGMEIEAPWANQVHAEAAAARPDLERVISALIPALDPVEGAFLEDKGLTLSVHYRQVDRSRVPEVREAVMRETREAERLRVTEGKEVLEVRPRVDWDKGRAVEFLLEGLEPAPGTPVLYLGDDTTDEDAFRALARWRDGAGEGVLVADPPRADTAARAFLRDSAEVGELLGELAERGP